VFQTIERLDAQFDAMRAEERKGADERCVHGPSRRSDDRIARHGAVDLRRRGLAKRDRWHESDNQQLSGGVARHR
jgi:hypothetical protein